MRDDPKRDTPFVHHEELIFDPDRLLTGDEQFDLLVRMELEERRTGTKIAFPDLQRLPVDPVTMLLFAVQRRCAH